MSRTCKVLTLLCPLVLTSCAAATSDVAADTDCRIGGEITVAAASSLIDAFEEIGERFETNCPNADITFTFDSSATLARQIVEGAPIDAFAAADRATMDEVTDAGLRSGAVEAVADNRLVLIARPGNPEGIETLGDLAGKGVISLCASDAPCGRLTAQALEQAGVVLDEATVTRGPNARATLGAVADGDAVAGIAYATDAQSAAGSVTAVELADAQATATTYLAATIDGPGDDDLARAFVAHLSTEPAQEILRERGFLPRR